MSTERTAEANVKQPKSADFEPPRIEDYGTLAELTAGRGSARGDFVGGQRGGGYS